MIGISKGSMNSEKLKSVEELQSMKHYWQHCAMENYMDCYIPIDMLKDEKPFVKTVSFSIDGKLYDNIRQITHSNPMASFVLLFSVFSVMICKYADENECVIATPVYNSLKLKGSYGNWIFIPCKTEGTMQFREYLNHMRIQIKTGFENQFCSMDEVLDELNIVGLDAALKRNMFLYENFQSKEAAQEFSLSKNHYLLLNIKESSDAFLGEFQYNTAHYSENSVREFVIQYQYLLEQILGDINVAVSELCLKTDGMNKKSYEAAEIITADNRNLLTIKEMWEQSVHKHSHKVAVVIGDHEYSYKDMNKRSSRLASYLAELGVKKEEAVVILAAHNIETVLAILALVKIGAAYIILEASDERIDLSSICAANQVNYVLYSDVSGTAINEEIRLLPIAVEKCYISTEAMLPTVCSPSDRICISYKNSETAGSCRIDIQHSNIVNYVIWHRKKQLSQSDNVREQSAVIATEISSLRANLELWTMLLNGITLHLLPKQVFTDSYKLCRYIYSNGIHILTCKHAIFHSLVSNPLYDKKRIFQNTSLIQLYGEPSNQEDIRKTVKQYPFVRISTEYGYEETTCVAATICTKEEKSSILESIDQVQLLLLNHKNHRVVQGATGEICIIGEAVCSGYSGNVKQGRLEEFDYHGVLYPMYRTGDFGYYDENGDIIVTKFSHLMDRGKEEADTLYRPEVEESRERDLLREARNEKEAVLLDIFRQVLGKSEFGINSNFFYAGGDSIVAIQIIGRLKQAGYELELPFIFKYQTIELLSDYVTKSRQSYDQNPVIGFGGLLPIQMRFMENAPEALNQFNHSIVMYHRLGLEETYVEKAFQGLVEHHDALRMIYIRDGEAELKGKIIQKNREIDCKCYQFEVMKCPMQDVLSFIQQDIEESQTKLNLFQGLLSIVKLYKTENGDYLSITIHHMVVDGVSWHILLEDFQRLYNQLRENKEASLPAKTASYLSWVNEIEEYEKVYMPEEERTYWENRLSLFSADDKVITQKYAAEYQSIHFFIDETMTMQLLKDANRAFRTNVDDLLTAVLAAALSDWRSEHEVSIMLEGHGRETLYHHLDISRTVGWFTSYYPVTVNTAKRTDVGEYIKEVKEVLHQIPNKGMGYGITRYLKHKDSLFVQNQEILFNYLGQEDTSYGNSEFERADIPVRNVIHLQYNMEFPLCLNCIVRGNRLELTLDYHQGLYLGEAVNDFIKAFKDNMKRMITYCTNRPYTETTVSDYTLSKLTKEELDEIKAIYQECNIEDIYTLSLMQEGMLYHWCTSSEKDLYCEQYMYKMQGQINAGLFNSCIKELIRTHQVLRTVFLADGLHVPHQIVLRNMDFEVEYRDFCSSASMEKDLEEYRTMDRRKGFDLTCGPMLRISLLTLDSQHFNILFSFHHIIMDGWSVPVLLEKLLDLYFMQAQRPPAYKERIQFRSYIEWLRSKSFQEAKEFWKEYLVPADTITELPYKTAASIKGGTGKHTYLLKREELHKLQAIAAGCNTTLYQVFQAMWSIVLAKYNRNDIVTFGTVISGRPTELPHAQELIGLCINTVPVVKRLNKDCAFTDYLLEGRQDELLQYGMYPLAEIQSLSVLKQNLLNHIMIFENYPISETLRDDSFAAKAGFKFNEVSELWKTNYDFNLMIVPQDGIELMMIYNEAAFEEGSIKQIMGHFVNVIRRVIQDKRTLIKDFELVNEAEKQKLLKTAWGPQISLENARPIHEHISEYARANPNHRIVTFKEISWTCKELEQASDNVAWHLIHLGVKPKEVVGVLMSRSHKLLAVLLGILKTGAAYLPMDKSNPIERIHYMLKDSNAVCAVISEDMKKDMLFEGKILVIDTLGSLTDSGEENHVLLPKTELKDIMYMIYTSGSTGNPKAVCLEHYSVYNFIRAMDYALQLKPAAKILCITTIAFDIFVLESYFALSYGYEVIMADEKEQINPSLLSQLILDREINTIQMTPSRIRLLLEDKKACDAFRGLDTVLIGGEALSEELLAKLKAMTKTRIFNVYGPTETTVWSSAAELTDAETVTIGRPIANTLFYVIDENNHMLPAGVPGELAIGGEGLAREYYKNETATDEKFIPNPFLKTGRIYKTGDIVCLQSDGNYKYIERKDFQLKIHGYRVELGEIENCIKRQAGVIDAVVLPKNKSGEILLICYYVRRFELDMKELLAGLHKQLPNYMIPSGFVVVDKIPTNASGKVDRKELLKLEEIVMEGRIVTEPADGIEQAVADLWKQYFPEINYGVEDDFFDIGGHSLKAINICSVAKTKGFDISINDLYNHPTVRGLAGVIKEKQRKEHVICDLDELEKLYQESFQEYRQEVYVTGDKEYILLILKQHAGEKPEQLREMIQSHAIPEIQPDYIIFPEDYDKERALSLNEMVDKYLPLADSSNCIGQFKNGFAWYKEEMINQFDRSEEEKSYYISGAQVLRMYDAQNIFTYIDIPEKVSAEHLQDVLLTIINEQGLLRSELVRTREGQYSWKQHGNFTKLQLPVVDLRKCSPLTLHQYIEDILHIMNEGYGTNYSIPLYGFVYIRVTERINRLLMVSNHIIFDGFSSQVLRHRLNTLLAANVSLQDKTIPQYDSYAEKIRKGPMNITDEQLNELCNIDKFADACKHLENILSAMDTSSSTTIHAEIPLSREVISQTDILQASFECFIPYIRDIFYLEQIPVISVNHGRQYGKDNYFASIGEFIDYVPFYYDMDSLESITDQMNRQFMLLSENNINFAELITNPKLLEKYGTAQRLNALLQNLKEKTFFIFNYQGLEDGNKEEITDLIDKETVYKLNQAVRFSTKVTKGSCHVSIYLPYRMEEGQVQNLKESMMANFKK
ncbi:MAG: amino acid adenylation domain-containing protein [Ruminiclostridium sp.]